MVSVFPTKGASAQDIRQLWWVDKETVMVGGCATIILDEACRRMGTLTLTIDDRSPTELMERAGITMQYTTGPGPGSTHTLILISHDFTNPEGLQVIAEDPVTYRMVPVFDKPGAVRLTVGCEQGSLGTKVVTVIPATPEAGPAVDLLYPVIVRKNGARPQSARVIQVLSNPAYGLTPRASQEDLEELYRDLSILREHPDWAEIFEMLVTRVEARIRANAFSDAMRTDDHDPDTTPQVPPISRRVQSAMDTHPQSALAKAIQDSLRTTVALPELLPHHSRTSAQGQE